MRRQSDSGEQAFSKQRLNEFVQNSNLGLSILDENLRFQAVNPWLASAHGVPPEWHVGKHIGEVLGEIAPRIEPALRKVLETGRPVLKVEVEGGFPERPERKHWVANYFPLKDSAGKVKQVAAVILQTDEGASPEIASDDAGIAQPSPNSELLRSWKEISAYMGTCVKTVQRWERAHALPVRRVTEARGAVVFAFRSEIDAWMRRRARQT
jgi:transcriptional regulator with PAS, ATPase and Fis domain